MWMHYTAKHISEIGLYKKRSPRVTLFALPTTSKIPLKETVFSTSVLN
jgi:hypothetical protein